MGGGIIGGGMPLKRPINKRSIISLWHLKINTMSGNPTKTPEQTTSEKVVLCIRVLGQ